ncbi:hypothetical protein SAMN04487988_105181 [Algoriphagus hitonicola]|uniref:Uncharacterized protein n=1 Tax=Algoriphagus hitonicola TaxID=435880 RepID=A0A1I2T1R9_9BACT|nr:hypothetical protein SAMN04487988_105181 [Algoriphagus hitonicola]
MKTKLHLNLLLSLVILIISCQSEKKSIENYIKYNIGLEYEDKFSIIILPFDACNACIHSSLSYISSNLSVLNKNKLIIYNFLSLKSSKMQYGEELFNHENTIIDSNGKFLEFDFKHNQPMIIQIENEDITKIENLDSSNFEVLLSKLH